MESSAGQPQGPPPGGSEKPPDQEELERRIEEQLRSVRVQDLLLESVAGILNLTARRIGKPDERDLEQARVGIDAVRAVLDLIDPAPREQVRQALSQVQMLFAREASGAEGAPEAGPSPEPSGEPGSEAGARGGPEQSPPRRPSGLWTPPGTS